MVLRECCQERMKDRHNACGVLFHIASSEKDGATCRLYNDFIPEVRLH